MERPDLCHRYAEIARKINTCLRVHETDRSYDKEATPSHLIVPGSMLLIYAFLMYEFLDFLNHLRFHPVETFTEGLQSLQWSSFTEISNHSGMVGTVGMLGTVGMVGMVGMVGIARMVGMIGNVPFDMGQHKLLFTIGCRKHAE